MKIVRTKSIPQPHPHYAGKTVADPTLRPSTSLKTPAHLFIHVGGTHQGGHQGGKTYIPRGARAQHEIAHFQKTTDPLIPYLPFKRLVREVLQDILESMFEGSMETPRISPNAILALRAAAEVHIAHMMKMSTLLANHGKRITLQPRDIQLFKIIMETGLGIF
ncbi:centromeric DNA-binding histone H3-like protein cse4 [Leucoagaricus gongylophorus]